MSNAGKRQAMSTLCASSFSAGEIATRERGQGFSLKGFTLPNPDPVLKRMGKDLDAYNDLLSDAQVGGCVESRKAGVLSLNWAINRGQPKDSAAEMIEALFKRLKLQRIMEELLDAALFGYNVSELIWEHDPALGGMVVPLDIRQKPQKWFGFDEDGHLLFKSREHPQGEPVPARKFLVPVNGGGWRNPYGFPVLSRVFWPTTFKKGGLKFWVTFTEKYGMPHIIAKVPRGKVTEESAELLAILEQMVQDAIAVIPDDSSIEIKDWASGGGSVDGYERLLNYCKGEISVGIIGQTLTTDVGDKGSYAAAKTHMAVRGDIVTRDKILVEAALNELIRWIYDFNFPQRTPPTFELYAKEDVDLDLADRDERLTRQGVKFTPEYYQTAYGLKPGDFTLGEPAPASQFAGKAAVETRQADPVGDLETAAGSLSPEELQGMVEDVLKPVLPVLQKASSFAEIEQALNQAYPAMDSGTFRDTLSKALFVSELFARAKQEQGAAK